MLRPFVLIFQRLTYFLPKSKITWLNIFKFDNPIIRHIKIFVRGGLALNRKVKFKNLRLDIERFNCWGFAIKFSALKFHNLQIYQQILFGVTFWHSAKNIFICSRKFKANQILMLVLQYFFFAGKFLFCFWK